MKAREPLIKWLRGRIGHPRCSPYNAGGCASQCQPHPARRLNQRFPEDLFRTKRIGLSVLLTWSLNVIAQQMPLAVGVPIAKSEQMLFADDPREWAKPRIVVPPTYPVRELAANVTGHVDVDVRIDDIGRVVSHQLVALKPEHTAFGEAVDAVVKQWMFWQAQNDACLPEPRVGNVRVWFEIKEGKGVVSVSNRSGAATKDAGAAALAPAMLNANMVQKNLRPPKALTQTGQGASFNVLMRVRAGTGEVTAVEVPWMRAPAEAESALRYAATSAYARGRFPVREGNDYAVCHNITMSLN